MSRVRFPSPAPILSPLLRRQFCCWFCILRSLFVKLPKDGPRGCGPIDVAADDAGDVLLLPRHDLGDHSLGDACHVEPGRRRAAQIMKVQIGVAHACGNLGLVERRAKAVLRPRSALAVRQDRCRSLWDGCEGVFQIIVQRDDRLAAMLAFAGRDDNGILTDV